MSFRIIHSDCLAALREMEAESVDSVVTDPPAGISFMGREWDGDKGGAEHWIEWLASVMREALRVAKPGAHAVVWALPRTSHWTGMALERAGWEIRDCITHVFGTGFPKSLDVSKAIDGHLGGERAAGVPGPYVSRRPRSEVLAVNRRAYSNGVGDAASALVTAPATPEAARWDGWGTALKPAAEFWWIARKPLGSTVAECVLRHGTGGLNVDGCRVGFASGADRSGAAPGGRATGKPLSRLAGVDDAREAFTPSDNSAGRWPPNVLLSHAPECRQVGTRRVRPSAPPSDTGSATTANAYGRFTKRSLVSYGDADGMEEVPAFDCAPGCPVAEMDRQSGELSSGDGTVRNSGGSLLGGGGNGAALTSYGDSGGASRFFPVFQYVAKPSRAERDAGLDDIPERVVNEDTPPGSRGSNSPRAGAGRNGGARNHHPTVKPITLMEWLVRLVTPPGGLVLDPFLGSGTTGCAAVRQGFQFVGIEREAEYVEIAERRIRLALNAPRTKPLGSLERSESDPRQASLFGVAARAPSTGTGEG